MLVTASAPAATQSATFAFTSTRDGQREIYQMNADGTGLLRLTDNAATDDRADYSPDSQRLAFTSRRDGQEEIYVMNADGTNLVRVTNHAASDINAAWSPDGTRLVFASDRDGDHEIYTVNPDGTNLTQLTANTSFDARPDWGSNNQIAFRSDRDGNAEIYTMNSDGSNQVNRTNNPAIDAAPVWSADGSQIAFVSQRDGNNEIYVMTADGTNAVNRTNNPASDASPDWSGDGVSIGWMTTRDGQYEIYKMEVDGSNVVRLTNHVAQETMPVWRPVVGGGASGGGVRWLVTDQLGTPRMTIDQTGSLASVRRHDYLPFGEELTGQGGRTTAQGYGVPDGVRQQFTGQERDGETGLDYFGARYYASVQGRFISVDPSSRSINPVNPQSWNRYTYCLNNPLAYVDRNGKWPTRTHRTILANAFSGLARHNQRALLQMQRGSESADRSGANPRTLWEWNAPKHAMTPGYMVRERGEAAAREWARGQANAFINDRMDAAREAYGASNQESNGRIHAATRDRAFSNFGEGAHTIMDAVSPAHRDFQVYDSLQYVDFSNPIKVGLIPFGIDMLVHSVQEGKDPTEGEMNEMVDALRLRFRQEFGEEAYNSAVLEEHRRETEGRQRERRK